MPLWGGVGVWTVARISVEQRALTDPRFYILGNLAGAPQEHCQAVGLYMAVRLWNESIEREADVLRCEVAQAIAQDSHGAYWFVDADLAEWVDDDETMLRVKGSEGRTDYLGAIRAGNRAGGLARAAGAIRDPKTGTFTRSTRLKPGQSSALTLTLTPAPTKEPKTSALQADFGLSPPEAKTSDDGFDAWWEEMRQWFKLGNRKLREKTEAKKLWKTKRLHRYADQIVERTKQQREHYQDAVRSGQKPIEPQDPHRFLKNRRYNDETP